MATTAPCFLLVLFSLSAALFTVQTTAAKTHHFTFFMQDIMSGCHPTSITVVKGPGATLTAPTIGMTFGDTTVIDDPITAGISRYSPELGRMRGIYVLSAQRDPVLTLCVNLLFTSGEHNGSTLALMGHDNTAHPVREIPIVGGTGNFRMATGYVLWRTVKIVAPDATVQLDVASWRFDTRRTPWRRSRKASRLLSAASEDDIEAYRAGRHGGGVAIMERTKGPRQLRTSAFMGMVD